MNSWLKLQAGCLFFPPLLATIIGFGRRSYDAAVRDFALHPFLATRPVGETGFALARFRAAAASTAATWGIVLAFMGAWLLLPARDDDQLRPAWQILAGYCTLSDLGVLLLITGILVFWTWKALVQGAWADVSGRPILVYGAPLVLHCLVLVGALALINGSLEPGELDPRFRSVSPWMTWLLVGLLCGKATCGIVSAAAVVRRGLLAPQALFTASGTWLLAVGMLIAVLYWIAAAEAQTGPVASLAVLTYLPFCSDAAPAQFHSPAYLAGGSILSIPFGRLLLLLLALHANRHR